jgi:hypothetical protein
MSTSKLYIDPAQVATAEKDDWAKFVTSRYTDFTLLMIGLLYLSAPSPVSRIIILSTTAPCGMDNS